jgi:NAD(P)-dependent dehydrogenase (short-subunit alcohol dehydrogenase family)
MHIFRDKVVLITGGSSGIGRATALRLARYGARVAVTARNLKALDEVVSAAEAGGGQALSVAGDVTDRDQCRAAVEATIARFGRLDILICSAGLSLRAYFERCSLIACERVMNVNFLGTLYMTHYALPHIKETRGSLVALSSLTGLKGIPSYGIYGASKFAVRGLYESLRLELHRQGVHVGVVSPGFVDTPLRSHVLNGDGRPWAQPPPTPFRIWPVEKCVDQIIRLLYRRRAQIDLPGYAGRLFLLDQLFGSRLVDWLLRRRFPPV